MFGHEEKENCRQEKILFQTGRSIPEFIHIPKTGGTYVEYLAENHPLIINGTQVKWGKFAKFPNIEDYTISNRKLLMNDVTNHCSNYHRPPRYWWQATGNLNQHVPYTSRTFCIVRNPYSRLISQLSWRKYIITLHKARCVLALNEVVEDVDHLIKPYFNGIGSFTRGNCHFLPQSQYVFDSDGCRCCDDVIYHENLTDELKSTMHEYGLMFKEDDFLDNKNYTSFCPMLNIENLPSFTIKMINYVYRDDFRNFGYQKILP